MINKFLNILNTFILELIGLLNLPVSNRPVAFCYHSISEDGWEFSRSKNDFISDLATIQETKKFIDLNSFINSSYADLYGKAILTFDDGYSDFSDVTFPILKDKKIPVTLFVIGEPEKSDRSVLGTEKNLLNINQIKELKEKGVDIGFHTNTHQVLNGLTENELEKEISKNKLEETVSTQIKSFAYPKGIKFKNYSKKLKEARYSIAFSVDNSLVHNNSGYNISRILISNKTSNKQLKAYLTEAWYLYSMFIKTLVNIKESIL